MSVFYKMYSSGTLDGFYKMYYSLTVELLMGVFYQMYYSGTPDGCVLQNVLQ